MKLNPNEMMNNTYTLKVINSKTNQVKQIAKAKNVVLARTVLDTFTYINGISVTYVYYGSGDGEPSVSDTALFHQLWAYGGEGTSLYPRCTSVRYNGDYLVYHLKASVPASTSYVGTITEIGLGTKDRLYTHAMLKDAEGNKISVEKTDLDKLELDIEVRITGFYDEASGFEVLCGSRYLLGYEPTNTNNQYNTYLALELGNFSPYCIGIPLAYHKHRYYKALWTSPSNTSNCLNSSTRKYTSGGRIAAEAAFVNHYVNSFEINGVGRFKLPNAKVIPNIALQGLSVGTGDGTKTTFEPPINLFVKDTDKIYVDGVVQTRGVDYTIDHKANRSLLHEITPGNFVVDITGGKKCAYVVNTRPTLMPFTPIIDMRSAALPSGDCNYTSRNDLVNGSYPNTYLDAYYYVLDGNNPLTIELEEDPNIGLDINGCMFRYFYIMASNGTSSFTNVDLVLEYSTDGNTFTEVCRADLTGHSYSKVYNFTFDTVNAKYWRLSLDFSRAAESEKAKKGTHYLRFADNANKDTYDVQMSMLYYKGEPIKFTNPPAAGSIITMDCELDRPFKTANNVIDIAYEIQL